MRTPRRTWIPGLLLLLTITALAQPKKPTQSQLPESCGCEWVAQELKKKSYYSETQAQGVINRYSSLFIHPAHIYTKKIPCKEQAIYAEICAADEEKYIFYTEEFLDQLTDQTAWGDQFVLAHEIAHHLLGHTERAFRLEEANRKAEARQAVNDVSTSTSYQTKNKQGIQNNYTISIPQRHLHELEADALGLWMVMQKKATRDDMRSIFKALPKILSVYSKSYDPTTSTDNHPSLFIRERLIDRYWDKYEKKGFAKRYSAIDEENNYKILAADTEAFYAFQLLSADKEKQALFNDTERSIRDSLSRRSRFFFDILLGSIGQRPVLHRAGVPVAATDSRSLTGGLRVGMGRWYGHHRFETDLKIANSTFTTQAELADGLRTVEQFRTTYLYVQPRYVYSRMDRLAKYAYRTSGWMVTGGASVSVPLRFSYTNYAASVAQPVKQRTGYTAVVGVGYGMSNWINHNGHFRLWLLYQPQRLQLNTDPSERVSAWLHTLSLDFSFRFW